MIAFRILSIAALPTVLLMISGCAQTDPYQRVGVWRPEGVVNADLAAQVADPRDLVRGHGDNGPHYASATEAVLKVWVGGPPAGASPLPVPQAQGAGAGAASGASR